MKFAANFLSEKIIPHPILRSVGLFACYFFVGFIVFKLITLIVGKGVEDSISKGTILEISSNFALVLIASYFIPMVINYTNQKSNIVSVILDGLITETNLLSTILDELLASPSEAKLILNTTRKIKKINAQIQFLSEVSESLHVSGLNVDQMKKHLIELKKLATNDRFSGGPASLHFARSRSCQMCTELRKTLLLLKLKNSCRID